MPDKLCWRLGPETVTAMGPQELRLDVSMIGEKTRKPEHAIIHEVQNSCSEKELSRIRESWPTYVTNLRKRFHCKVTLLAMCPDERSARVVGESVDTGHPGFIFTPVTYWPGMLAAAIDPTSARTWPELVLLAATSQLSEDERRRVLEMVPAAVASFDDDRGVIYYEFIRTRLPEAARLELEEIMTISLENFTWESDFALKHQAIGRKEGRAEGEAVGRAEGEAVGRAEGEAVAVLTVLAARGIEVDAVARELILACGDTERLTEWLTRAVSVTSVEDLFVDSDNARIVGADQ
ncbi:hypothetical protein [Nocardia alni]|uniref:hypothetical protein n=1 Tax=Nocardia alni TaxID=2815723 RepID=UPI001C2127AF|nr:hypothetical protein [Nocardia alni]